MSKKKAIGRAVRGDKYEFTRHALDEMDDDELSEADVRQALLHGRVVAELTDDPAALAMGFEEPEGFRATRSR